MKVDIEGESYARIAGELCLGLRLHFPPQFMVQIHSRAKPVPRNPIRVFTPFKYERYENTLPTHAS